MREKKEFAVRTRVRNSDLPNKTFFLVFEGTKTEDIYFSALIDKKRDLGINPLIQLVPLVRSFGEEGWSNPQKIAERVERMVKEQISGKITYETLVIDLLEYLIEQKLIPDSHSSKTTTYKLLQTICFEKLTVGMTDEVDNIENRTKELLSGLSVKVDIENIAKNMGSIIKSLDFMYYPELDTICLICDRDKNSFVVNERNNQYQKVINICKKNKFQFCISNPCFEFWLLLHVDNCKSLDEEKLLENECVSRTPKQRCTYTETELKKRIPSYEKNSYDALALIEKIDTAIKNEKAFCEDIKELEDHVGSNIGVFISELRK